MGNPFVHIDLQTNDPERAKAFYGKLLDWELQPMPEMDYTMINVGEGTGGGIGKGHAPDVPPQWLPFIQVGDVAETTQKARELGATVAMEASEIPNIGWFSIIVDPTGARVGFFQGKEEG
jgi:predicted enzyme related to lactoylglutathione lyase